MTTYFYNIFSGVRLRSLEKESMLHPAFYFQLSKNPHAMYVKVVSIESFEGIMH